MVAEQAPTFTPTKVVREPFLAEKIVFVDGLPGCGKTMLAPIVGALRRVELMRYNYHLEHTCVLRHLGSITEDATVSLLRLQTDLDIYDSMMSRETNFRFSDLSSPSMNRVLWKYVRRLFLKGDAAIPARIESEKPILHLVTHSLLGVCKPLFKALGSRMQLIEGVRHPLYMIKQWYAWMPRSGTDPRFFGIWIDYQGHTLPWFAKGWEELYLRSNRMDRTIYAIINQSKLGLTALKSLSDHEQSQIYFVPFERFVIQPKPYLSKIAEMLGSEVTSETHRMMKQQNVPRSRWAEGVDLKIYKQYGWEPPAPGSSEKEELSKRRGFVAAEATPEALKAWDDLCLEYERQYLFL